MSSINSNGNIIEKHTLIVNNIRLQAGGIENTVAALMKYALSNDYRVIWITNQRNLAKVAYEDILEHKNLELLIIPKWRRATGLLIPHISFDEDECVTMITANAPQYVISDALKRNAKVKSFSHYFLVAHYKIVGGSFFPDAIIKNAWLKKQTYLFWRKIVQRLDDSDCLRAFSPKHLSCYEDYYHIKIDNKQEKVLPEHAALLPLNLQNTRQRCLERNTRFIISTCARFEFPHKGYILGLVDSFAKLKEKYPQISLEIIGYGEGEKLLREKIHQLPKEIADSILLTGMLSPKELREHQLNAHLVVGLAGAIHVGAECGIPSLVTRHYSTNCETYGFYENAVSKTLAEEPGEDIVKYIEDCITMSEESYMKHVVDAYILLESNTVVNPGYLFQHTSDASSKPFLRGGEWLQGWLLYMYWYVDMIWKKYFGKSKL